MMLLVPGDVFANRFEIHGAAGSGGMGTIYRARDQLSGDIVALKLLHNPGPEGNDKERFIREGQLLAELAHPGIVAHVAHGQTPQGLRFLAMQWLEGQDLAQRLTKGHLTLSESLTLSRQVAEALAFAHRRGVMHRDLKPTNLFLPGQDISRVKILDFGVARRLVASKEITRTGTVIGTPEYMAPEQARGVRELTPAVDIFALGCILYECLVGEPPFAGDNIAAVLVRILFEEPAAVTELRPGIPQGVAELVARMLAKDPGQRLGDAAEVAARLAALEGMPDLPLLPPLSGPKKATPATPEGEQALLSLVLAMPPRQSEGGSSALLDADTTSEFARHEPLLAELRPLGAEADLLLGGAIVVTLQRMPSAKDQAFQAARVAMMILEHWPEARIAVVTGRGSRSRGLITGEVLDRAFRLLGRLPTPSDDLTSVPKRILLDTVSADLLETRFELRPITGGFSLEKERAEDDVTRLLLGHPTPCVGRERELSVLEGTLRECGDESVARAVLVLAPPGLGKSRLRHEFVRRLRNQERQPLLLLGRGDPMKVKSSYGLLGEALRQHCRIREGQAAAEQQACLHEELGRHLPAEDVQRVAEFLGELCGIPFLDLQRPQLRAARREPRVMSDQVEQAWLDWLRATTKSRPALLILEDIHWADALTMKLCQAALRGLPEQPLMVLALARPEVKDLYPNLFAGTAQEIVLKPLPKRASERLVRQVLGAEIPADDIARLIERSAGNPLFLEELIRAAAERKTGQIPETVSAMLQARIGRLATRERKALRAASVFGENFWDNGIRYLLRDGEEAKSLDLTLSELIREESIEEKHERRFSSQPEYRFRHALVRDAAYGLLSEQEAHAWHSAAAEFLESVGERDVVVLAEHYRLGQKLALAVKYYLKAAEQAYDVADAGSAQVFAERGLACGAQAEERGSLLSVQVSSAFWNERYQEVLALGPETLELLPLGSKSWSRVFEGLFPAAVVLQQPAMLEKSLRQFIGVDPAKDAQNSYVRAACLLSIMLYVAGQKDPAELLLERARQVCATMGDDDINARFWILGAENNRSNQGMTVPYTNLLTIRQTVQGALRIGHRNVECLASVYHGKALLDLGQREAALPVMRRSLLQAERINDDGLRTYARVLLASMLADGGDADEVQEASVLAGLALSTQNLPMRGLAHGVLAKVALRNGELDAAASAGWAAWEILKPFPPYRLEPVALLCRILTAQGNEAEALRVCEDMVQEIEALGLKSCGLLELYVTLAEAHLRAGTTERARQIIERALPVLRQRVEDIKDADLRKSYLRKVPENVRLLELCARCRLDTADLTRDF